MRNEIHNPPPHQKFLQTLARSLHQMAQPISVIQASLELALLSPTSAEQYHEIAGGLLEELQRAIECMQFTACLTRLQQPSVGAQEALLSITLDDVIADLRRTLESAQIHLLFFRSEPERAIRISPARLRQMLFYVLQAVQELSQAGDFVHVEVREMGGRLLLRIKRDRGMCDEVECYGAATGLAQRALALAEAVANSAGAEFSFCSNPFRIVVDFPVAGDTARAVAKEAHGGGPAVQLVLNSRP